MPVAPPLDDDTLLRDYAATRDPALRERLVERYLPLARFAASRYSRGREPVDDLIQVASLGLLKAIDRYDPEKASAFSSFAMPTMVGEIRRYFRDRSWTVRPPRDLQEQALAVEAAIERLTTDKGHAPTIDDVAEATGLAAEDVLEAKQALGGRHAASLDAGADDHEDEPNGIARRLGTLDGGFARAEDRATLELMTRTLTARDREIVRLRFEEDLTQAEIGEVVGLSQMHVSRLLRDAIAKLRAGAE